MPYGKSRPENRFRNEAAFFIGQMEVQIRVISPWRMESADHCSYSFRGSQGVPMEKPWPNWERRNTGIKRYAGWLSLRKRRCWECLYHVHWYSLWLGCQPRQGYGLTHGKEGPSPSENFLSGGRLHWRGVTAEFAIRALVRDLSDWRTRYPAILPEFSPARLLHGQKGQQLLFVQYHQWIRNRWRETAWKASVHLQRTAFQQTMPDEACLT